MPAKLYAQVATAAPVALVFARIPAKWWLVARWHLDSGRFEPGAWFRGTLYPRRCDVSPDGALLYYFALKGSAFGLFGKSGPQTFSAVSKAPWLHALAAWPESGTWTRGCHFVRPDRRGLPWDLGDPPFGDARPLRRRYGLAHTPIAQYAAELRRGFVEHARCPPRSPSDVWDERREVVLAKRRPSGDDVLVLSDRGWSAHAPDRIEGRGPLYAIERGGRTEDLTDVVWADWDRRGRLLVATRSGTLEVREAGRRPNRTVSRVDVGALRPDPGPAPPSARRW